MDWLNYHHLLYFWLAAREGGVLPAARRLRLSHSTVSGQIHALEERLGDKLFSRQGRRLVLTETGRLVFRYADEIFSLGRELLDAVAGRPTGQPVRLDVGIVDVLPKLVVRRILEPALHTGSPVHLVCHEDNYERLLAGLATHELDVVIADAPLPAGSSVRAWNHLLGECGVTFFGAARHAGLRKGFPRSLDGAPLLMPTENAPLRRALVQWFESISVRPRVVAEFEDSALLKVFGGDGLGVFPAATAVEEAVRRQYDVEVLGRAEAVRERFYAVSVERRLKNPAVVAISEAARHDLFAPEPAPPAISRRRRSL